MIKVKMEKVRVGQLWQDWDVRFRKSRPRIIKIISISGDGLYATCRNIATSKTTKIAINRFKPTSTGYKLFQDCKVW